MNAQRLEQLVRRWRWMVATRELCYAFAAGCIVAALLLPWSSWFIWGLVVCGGVFALRLTTARLWRFDSAHLVRQLNRSYPELEESGALWLRSPDNMTLLERLQCRRINQTLTRLTAANPRSSFGAPEPAFLKPALVAVAMAACLVGASGLVSHLANRQGRSFMQPVLNRATTPKGVGVPSGGKTPPRITSARTTIVPPSYTGKLTHYSAGLSAEIEEGSSVGWEVILDQPVHEAKFIFGQGKGDALPLQARPQGGYEARRMVAESGLYHLTATLPDGGAWTPPDVYSLKVVKDRPPVIKVLQPIQPRTEIAPPVPGADAGPPILQVEVNVADDYAVVSARMVATVAKGSGEAVKFREQSIEFDGDQLAAGSPAPGEARRFAKALDLGALGMEPGDELYFYVEAADNRRPIPNRARSETRFVVLKGPETRAASSGQGVAGVNLVPQYFRSERQIIIDAEKLIAERPTVRGEQFNQRSNDLGIDQQLLRLRYGQFLGEELEQGQGAGDQTEVSLNPLERGVPRDMIHEHDHATESGPGVPAAGADPRAAARTALRLQLQHAGQAAGHPDEHGAPAPPDHPVAPATAEQVIAPFVDEHDSQDKATLFDHGAKSTMRDALAAMWDAEKFLRTNRPEEALAPANKALAILKDIQQSARAYVQHVGFEPAPLKIDHRRLQSSVSEVRKRVAVEQTTPPGDPALGSVRQLLQDVAWRTPLDALTVDQRQSLRQAEPALTAAAIRQPELYLSPLQTLRSLAAQQEPVSEQEVAGLQKALLHLLPPASARPGRVDDSTPETNFYFQALDKLEGKS